MALTPVVVGTLVLAPADHTSTFEQITIVPADDADALDILTGAAITFQLGSHYVQAAESQGLRVDQYGNVHFGKNLLLAPYPFGNFQSSVADCYWSADHQRLAVRSMIISQVDDPPDITFMRFGPTGGYPYAVTGNGDGDYTDLTGIASGSGFCQIAGIPAATPFGGTVATGGATAVNSSAIWNFLTSELPRDLTGLEDFAQGSSFRLSLSQIGAKLTDYLLQVNPGGAVQIGRTAIDHGFSAGTLVVRGDSGRNDAQRVEKSGTVSGGTFKLFHYGAPAASPKFGGSGVALTGTLAVTVSSAAVVGTGTLFTTELAVGDRVRVASDVAIYEVATITDNTHLALTAVYAGSAAAAASAVRAAQISGAIAYNATNDAFQTAMEAMSTIGTGTTITGTITATNGSNAITGSSTVFTTDLREGDYIRVGTDSSSTLYLISGITSDTALTISVVYAGVGGAGQACQRVSVAVTGGPVNSATTTLTFCGSLRNTNMVRMGVVTSALTGGGSYSVGTTADGRASGGDQLLARFQHGGKPRSVPTSSYYQWIDPAGTTVQELDNTGLLTATAKSMATSTQTLATSATLVDRSAEIVLADTTTVPITATLPASPTEGTKFVFIDKASNWGTKNLVIARNGKNIDGAAANKTMSSSNTNATLLYAGGGWWTV